MVCHLPHDVAVIGLLVDAFFFDKANKNQQPTTASSIGSAFDPEE
jgi:hypothetical protein